MKLFIRLIVSAVAVYVTDYILSGVKIESTTAILVVVVVFGVLNAFLKPILVLLTLPVTVLTLGLFMLVINAFLVMLASAIVPGFHVDGFFWAVAFSVVLSLVGGVLHSLEKKS